jgi:hypothetical protein
MQVVRRQEILAAVRREDRAPLVPAVLGTVAEPSKGILASKMLEAFEAINAAALKRKSPKQVERWWLPKQTALDQFIKCVGGDKPVAALTHADARTYRKHWEERVLRNEVEIETANKNLGRISVMFNAINDFEKLDLPNI